MFLRLIEAEQVSLLSLKELVEQGLSDSVELGKVGTLYLIPDVISKFLPLLLLIPPHSD